MGVVFEHKDSVFFIGGTGTKAGVIPSGGVTRAKYEAMVAEDGYFDMTRIMGANGDVKWDVFGAILTEYQGGSVMITKAGAFTGVEAGMLAYIDFSSAYDDGMYEITGATDDVIIISSLNYISNVTVTFIGIGGAFSSLQDAVDYIDATSHSVWLLTNKDEMLTSTLDITAGGSITNNHHLYIWGFNTSPPTNLFEPSGDMDFNETTKATGTYYASALDIKINGSVPAGKKVVLDGNDAAIQLVTITSGRNIHFRNFEFKDVASNNDLIELSGTAIGLVFCGCAITGNYEYVMDGSYQHGAFFYDCYFKESQYYSYIKWDATLYAGRFYRCLFDLGNNIYVSAPHASFVNCIFVNGVYGFRTYHNCAYNCTFYSQSIAPARSDASTFTCQLVNCIIIPAEGVTDFAVSISAGSINFVSNNVYYGADGVALAKPFDQSGVSFTPFGGGNLAQDPSMVDPANNNFKPRNQNVLTRGVSDINGNPSQIGAVIAKHRSKSKASMSNQGRMKIFR